MDMLYHDQVINGNSQDLGFRFLAWCLIVPGTFAARKNE
jgi:hypothetical protein